MINREYYGKPIILHLKQIKMDYFRVSW